MQLNRRTIVVAVSVTLLAICSLAIFRTPAPAPAKVPAWVKHYETAEKVWLSGTYEEWDRQAKLVLNDSAEYGGKMPPQEPMSAEQAQMESTFWFFPMQDRGETMSYAEALGNLAIHYRNGKKWDDAELFHRKILELQQAEWRAHPKTARMPDPSILIDILSENGKKKEAIELQKQAVTNAELAVAKQPGYTALEPIVFLQRAKYLELQGRGKDAEACWLQILDIYKSELTEENLAKKKRENANASIREGYTSNLFSFRWLEDLADFYRKHKDAAGEERTLLKILSLRQAILPDNYPGMKDDFDNLTTFYEKHQKYDQAEKTILQRMQCREDDDIWQRLANAYVKQGKYDEASKSILKSIALVESEKKNPDKEDLASLYFWNSLVLQREGKRKESAQAKERALSIDPSAHGYFRIWN